MNKKREKRTILGLILIIISTSIVTIQSEAFESASQETVEVDVANGLPNKYPTKIPLLLNYTLHEPIKITNDDELAEIASNGTGIENDPFIISGWNITGSDIAILILGTSKHFVIRECLLKSNVETDLVGIRLDNVANGTAKIEKNTFQGNYLDIMIVNCDGLKIFNNSIVNSLFGLNIIHSNNSQILGNNFSTIINSIRLEQTSNYLICNNSFLDGEYSGIELFSTVNITIHNNYFKQDAGVVDYGENLNLVVTNNVFNQSNRWGLYLSGNGLEGTIANNRFINTGIFISSTQTYNLIQLDIYNNTVNDLPLGWLTYEKNITLTEKYGQLFLLSCSNIIVENQVISNCSAGIILVNCYDIIVRNNTCIGCLEAIKLCYSKNIDIYNNSCFYSEIGISCDSSLQNVKISDNTCSFNMYGISVVSEVLGTILENNICLNNNVGIEVVGVNNALIINNTCKFNDRGIHVVYSDYCDVMSNRLESNNYGIYIYSFTDDNLIFNNAFIDNNVQAVDNGDNNLWCNLLTLTGNYWSDYLGSGSYKISGYANSEDYCPLNEQMIAYPGGPFTTVDDITLDDEQPINQSRRFDLGSSENLFISLVGCFYVLVYFKRKKKTK